MTTPRNLRTVAAVLVVVLVLLTIWSAYNLYVDSRASNVSTPTQVAAYLARGNGSFVATLVPNVLCNCTHVEGGNVTLFPSITRWVNVTLDTSLSVDVPATISTIDHFTVTLVSAVWSKSIYSSPLNRSLVTNTATASTQNQYTINVSSVENQIEAIENTTHYTIAPVWLTLSSTVLVSITVSGEVGTATLGSVGNFSFFPSSISTGFPSRTTTGAIDVPGPSDGAVPFSAFLIMAVFAVGLAGSVAWYARLYSRSGKGEEEPIPDLEELIAPYEEVIAETASVPDPAATVRIDRWEGLVKISDTLGKPILRPSAGKPSQLRTSFYVLDGDIGYLYRYRSSGTEPGPSASGVADLTGGPGTALKRMRSVAARIEALAPDDSRFPRALARFRRLRALVQARRWLDVERVLVELEQLLDNAEKRTQVSAAGGRGPSGRASAPPGSPRR